MSRPVTPASAAPLQPYDHTAMLNSHSAGQGGSRPVSYAPSEKAGFEAVDHANAYGANDDASVIRTNPDHIDTTNSDANSVLQRSNSQLSQSQTAVPSRGGTLKKKASMKRTGSLKRSGSRKSSYAGSVRSLKLGEKEKYDPSQETNSAFYCPIPTSGNPTELLADRFQAWRKVLKDLIGYFRDLQKSYDTRSKTLISAGNVINNSQVPPNFLASGGLADATHILRDFHKLSLSESNKSKELENEVILQLTGLRSDLQQKIKEIKSLSGDFKNSVGKEQEGTRKAVRALQEALGTVDHDAASSSGKGDPFLVKMGVDRQLEKQIEEENYLHRAYLNLEASGRELESIVVGEIQKAYNVLAGILKREGDHCYETAEKMREGPLGMARDHEWDSFVTNNDKMVDPRIPLRTVEQITYSGKDHPAAIDVRSGMLERKSKYLKNYTPGWYVLSPTHLHEFKSADKIAFQAPIMSLYLPEQKLGTHSEPGSSSHKFMLKGRQSGGMHRGHSWIFRAESHDTMLAWFHDIKELTEKRGEARNDFVRRTHARTLSQSSAKAPSIGSAESGMEEDEADQVAFSSEQSVRGQSISGDAAAAGVGAGAAGVAAYGYSGAGTDDGRSDAGWRPPQRPTPGGRFPSEINVQRGLAAAPKSPSSQDSDDRDRDAIAAAGALPGSGVPFVGGMQQQHTDLQDSAYFPTQPVSQGQRENSAPASANYTAGRHPNVVPTGHGAIPNDASSAYGEWMAPIAGVVGGAAVGAGATHLYDRHQQDQQAAPQAENVADQMSSPNSAIPAPGHSSAPIMDVSAAPLDAPIEPRASTGSTAAMSGHTTATTAPTLTTGTTLSDAPGSVTYDSPTATQPLAKTEIDATQPSTTDAVSDVNASGVPVRPQPVHAKSVQTISDLHVPGEFPKNTQD